MRNASMLWPASLALLLLGAAGSASAQSGTLTFNGVVSNVTCEVSFDGVVGEDATVSLPKVAASSLLAGQSGGRTPVLVRISGSDPICSSDRLSMVLNANRSANLLNGRLRNTGIGIGGGTNALVGLRDLNDAPIDLTGGVVLRAVRSPGSGMQVAFAAEYYADGQDAVPGAFQAPLRYTLTYP